MDVEETVLLEKKTHICGKNNVISYLRPRMTKKSHFLSKEEGFEIKKGGTIMASKEEKK